MQNNLTVIQSKKLGEVKNKVKVCPKWEKTLFFNQETLTTYLSGDTTFVFIEVEDVLKEQKK